MYLFRHYHSDDFLVVTAAKWLSKMQHSMPGVSPIPSSAH